MKINKKAFTLIELVSVLVILAILALIVTPLVLNIIRKARIAADKRSIDAYGRSIKLAISDYLLENGTLPTSIEELTIEYSGDRVVCSTTKLNSDSSVYLAECTVNNRAVTGYTYGKEEKLPVAYKTGDEITYNGIDYYVLKDSEIEDLTVTLLKSTPLTYDEVNTYGEGHVNMYVTNDTNASYYQKAVNHGGYGALAYYGSSTCFNFEDQSGCTNEYGNSEIKYVVDAWALDKVPNGLIEARLITYEELDDNMSQTQVCTVDCYETIGLKYKWLYDYSYQYWTMSPYGDSTDTVWIVDSSYRMVGGKVNFRNDFYRLVRPVIVLSKAVL